MSQVGESANKKVGQARSGSGCSRGVRSHRTSVPPASLRTSRSDISILKHDQRRLVSDRVCYCLESRTMGCHRSLGKNSDNGSGLFWSLGDWPHLREACDEASWRSELCRSLASPYPGLSIPLVHSFPLVASLFSTNININPFPANTHLGSSVVKVQLVRTLPLLHSSSLQLLRLVNISGSMT